MQERLQMQWGRKALLLDCITAWCREHRAIVGVLELVYIAATGIRGFVVDE